MICLSAHLVVLSVTVPCLTVLALGCSGDQSLGSGFPAADAASAFDGADLSAPPGSSCSNHVGTDAASGVNENLLAWYRCESAGTSGNVLLDSSGHANDGKLLSGIVGSSGYTFSAGKVGNALYLTEANKGYAALPAGILANACEATIATWVYINSTTNAWSRIWDFGKDTTSYMYLTRNNNLDHVARFGISNSGNTHEEVISGQNNVGALSWTHVAVVLGPSGGTLYFDGVPVGTNTAMKLRPADLGSTPNNYIGRSQFPSDPYFDGDVDEFRIYNRALSTEEIHALASGS